MILLSKSLKFLSRVDPKPYYTLGLAGSNLSIIRATLLVRDSDKSQYYIYYNYWKVKQKQLISIGLKKNRVLKDVASPLIVGITLSDPFQEMARKVTFGKEIKNNERLVGPFNVDDIMSHKATNYVLAITGD